MPGGRFCHRHCHFAAHLPLVDRVIKRTHINGIPIDQWGMWCAHGKHVMVADPNDGREFPDSIMADPWPCNECTPEQLAAAMREEEDEYNRERWDEYWNTVREGFYP